MKQLNQRPSIFELLEKISSVVKSTYVDFMSINFVMRIILACVFLTAFFLAVALVRYFVIKVDPSAYLTVKVVRGDIENTVLTTGSIQANQQVDVGAQVSGQLKSLKVRLGDHVEKGQLLAEIDPLLSQKAYQSAAASMESLEAQRLAVSASLQQAKLAYERQQKMFNTSATSRQEVEIAKAQLQVQSANLASFDAQIKQAETQVDTARANLDYTKIIAPMSGEVVAIVTQEGQTVVASQQAPVILKLANLDIMTVKALVSEADVIHVQKGQSCYFTILGDNAERHLGKVSTVEPAPQDFSEPGPKVAGPVYYNALFNTLNEDHRLRIGMTAQVAVVLNEARNVLIVPLSSLGAVNADGRYPVRVLGKTGLISTKMIKVGINDSVSVEVIDGVTEEDEVITQGGAGN